MTDKKIVKCDYCGTDCTVEGETYKPVDDAKLLRKALEMCIEAFGAECPSMHRDVDDWLKQAEGK
jgi:hypothetical protein